MHVRQCTTHEREHPRTLDGDGGWFAPFPRDLANEGSGDQGGVQADRDPQREARSESGGLGRTAAPQDRKDFFVAMERHKMGRQRARRHAIDDGLKSLESGLMYFRLGLVFVFLTLASFLATFAVAKYL